MRKAQLLSLLVAAWLVVPQLSLGLPIDFEGLADGTVVTSQFAGQGVIFANATVATAGITLNEVEFPPHSGINVVFDDGGAIVVAFTVPFLSASGFFTYNTQLTLNAFDPSNNFLGSVTSAFSSNAALSGDVGSSPNEFLQLAGLGPIGKIEILGDPGGGSFVLDDFNGTPTPEPASLLLLGSGFGVLGLRKRWRTPRA